MITPKGYVRVKTLDTRGFRTGRLIMEHVAVAQRALGKPLPKDACVHHINGIRSDNRPENLVICQDQAYHLLLHRRQRALDACGDSNKVECWYGKHWDMPEAMTARPNGQYYHPGCAARWAKEQRAGKPTKSGRKGFGWATETHCRHGHLWTDDTLHINPKGVRVCRACDRARRNHPTRHQRRA